MKNANSNVTVRRNALIRAIILVFATMVFTGFGVGLFPIGKYLETREAGSDYRQTKEALAQLTSQVELIAASFARIENLYDSLSTIDQDWEREKSSHTRSIWKQDIQAMERSLTLQVSQLKNIDPPGLSQGAAAGWEKLIVSRGLLWDYRDQLENNNGGSGEKDECEEELRDIRRESLQIAYALRTEANELENKQAKGWFGNKDQINQVIQNATSDLKRLADRIVNL